MKIKRIFKEMKRRGMRDEEEKCEQDKNKEVCEEQSQKKS
jgi:hypothetical protein